MPERWDGITDINLIISVYLAGAEDIDDTFKLQISYNSTPLSNAIIPDNLTDIEVQQSILTGRAAQYNAYHLAFLIPVDGISGGDKLGVRLRRIASTGTEINNEIVAFDAILEFRQDKLGGLWS